MRAAVGLVGLLICLGVTVYFMGAKGGELDRTKAVLDAGKKATEAANQLSGRDRATGAPARESATLEAQTNGNGAINGILVATIVSDGAYATFWGLQRNDVITEIGPLDVKGQITSESDANVMVQDAYQRHMSLTVLRDGQKTTLNGQEPTPPKSSGKSNDPLDVLQQIPTH